MAALRKPFQGVANIIRFNRHFYLLSGLLLLMILLLSSYLRNEYTFYIRILGFVFLAITLVSLLVSLYVYDLSGFYALSWLDRAGLIPGDNLVNVHAGFDETSGLLAAKYPGASLLVLDFYDPVKHTEVSIRRARKAYPAYPGTKKVGTSALPLGNEGFDTVFLILAAHEIRNDDERLNFFRELHRALKNSGTVVVTEHLRDLPNFLAYNIGFFHFLPASSWHNTFGNSGFNISGIVRVTPFIKTYMLKKSGTAS